jgi:hypothetical protein
MIFIGQLHHRAWKDEYRTPIIEVKMSLPWSKKGINELLTLSMSFGDKL